MKALSELLAEVEPSSKWIDLSVSHLTDTPYDHVKPCNIIDRASYDKLKAVAVELAKALEFYSKHHHHIYTTAPNFANEALTNARKLMVDE